MAKQSDQLASAPRVDKKTEKTLQKTGGSQAGVFAEENEFDRRALWRIGSWGAAAVGAVTLAVMSNQWSLGLRREQVAAADLARQAQQIQSLTKESQNETRRLASAIETLNNDRDRLFSRVTVIEQGLDSVTGALAKQVTPGPAASTAPQASAAAQASNLPAATQASQQNAVASVPAPVATTAAAAPDKPRADAGKSEPSAEAATARIAETANAGPATTATTSPDPTAAAASLTTKSIIGPPDPAAPELSEAAKPADAKVSDIKPADAKAADIKMAMAKVDARLDAKADAKGPDTTLAAASEVVASANAMDEAEAEVGSVTVKRTDFAVDLGGANSLGGLRALWRGVRHVNAELGALNPIVVIREGHTGFGMQLHLAAGPLKDAAAAARICAVLADTKRSCETTVYDGQRLAMKSDEAQSLAAIKAAGPEAKSDPKASDAKSSESKSPEVKPEEAKAETRSGSSRHGSRHAKKEEQPPPPPQPESTSTFSSLFGRR